VKSERFKDDLAVNNKRIGFAYGIEEKGSELYVSLIKRRLAQAMT
jgi:hypothetical protein